MLKWSLNGDADVFEPGKHRVYAFAIRDCLETGRPWSGGIAVDYIRKYPGRSTTVHLKEWTADDDSAILGAGDVSFAGLVQNAEQGESRSEAESKKRNAGRQ